MRNRNNRYFVLLTDIDQASIETVVSNFLNSWRSTHGNRLMILDENEFVDNSAGGKNPARPEGFQIAVVDDDVVNLQLAGRILSKAGFYVAALKSGPALLDYIENNTPSLILLDINMPVMDGVETLAEISNRKLVDEKAGDTDYLKAHHTELSSLIEEKCKVIRDIL